VADDLVHQVGGLIRHRMRGEDIAGRFDGSRFLLLLRRVDSQLGTLIIQQLMEQLNDLCSDRSRWGAEINVRGGVAGSGTETPELSSLISQALTLCQQARDYQLVMSSDLMTVESKNIECLVTNEECRVGNEMNDE